MKKKIVMIVNNPSETGKGLNKVLGDYRKREMSHQLINRYLFRCESDEYGFITITPQLDESSSFLLISGTGPNKQNELTTEIWKDNWDIVLILDTVDPAKYIEYFDGNTMVVYHRIPDELPEMLKQKFDKRELLGLKQGEHEKDGEGYSLLTGIIDAYDPVKNAFNADKYGEAIERIYAWFGVNEELETILDLLHICLLPAGAAKANEIKGYDIVKNKTVTEDLTVDEFIKSKLANDLDRDCFSDDYIENLRVLRDILLDE